MYCHECGAETKEGYSFCKECGTELRYQTERSQGRTEEEHSRSVRSDSESTAGTPSERDIETEAGGTGTGTETGSPEGRSRPADRGSGSGEETWFEMSRVFENAGVDIPEGSNAADQSRELATNALFGYGFVVLIRLTGVSGLIFYFGGSAASGGFRLYDAAVFVFYDGFVFALLGLLTSGYLVARFYFDVGEIADHLETIDRIAAIGLPASSLLYALGAIGAFLF